MALVPEISRPLNYLKKILKMWNKIKYEYLFTKKPGKKKIFNFFFKRMCGNRET